MSDAYTLADSSSGICALNMNNEFNLFGKQAYLVGHTFELYFPIDDAPVEKQLVVEKKSFWGLNLATGILATLALGALAVAAIATGGAALVFAGVCLAGAAVGTAVVTTVASIEDYKSGTARSWGDFVMGLTGGAIQGAVAAATIYALWFAAPVAGEAVGLQVALWAGKVSSLTVTIIPSIVTIGGYTLLGTQGIRHLNELVMIGNGQNWLLDQIFGGNQEYYDGAAILIDLLSLGYLQIASDNAGLAKDKQKNNNELPSYADDKLDDISSDTWDQGPVVRGDAIDESQKLKNNLGHNFPTADKLDNRVLESTKSYDTTGKTYSDASKFLSKIKGDVNKLDNFTSGQYNGVVITANDYDVKQLNVVIPNVALTASQQEALQSAKEYAGQLGILIKVYITN